MKTETIVATLAEVRAACASVNDPEFGLSIDDFGLIYDVSLQNGLASVAMTLTTPYCPVGDIIVNAVHAAVSALPGVARVEVRVVWDPPWVPEMVSPRGRELLGWTDAN